MVNSLEKCDAVLPLRRVGDLSEAVEGEEEDVVPMALLRMSKMKPEG